VKDEFELNHHTVEIDLRYADTENDIQIVKNHLPRLQELFSEWYGDRADIISYKEDKFDAISTIIIVQFRCF
jgi:hypothetical protein